MSLRDVAMVAADTTRTKYYIEGLIKGGLLPHYVLLLLNSNSELLPGQKEVKAENKLIMLLRDTGVKYDVAPNSNINSDEVILVASIINNPGNNKVAHLLQMDALMKNIKFLGD